MEHIKIIMRATERTITIYALSIVITAGIFILDLLTPLGTGVWLGYILPLIIIYRELQRRYIYAITAVFTVLLALGFVYSPPGIQFDIALSNRFLAAGVVWTTLIFLLHYRRAEEERDRLYREAQAARERVTTILRSITDAFLSFDREWRVIRMNQKAEQLLRKKHSELIGKIYWEVFPDAVDTIGYRELHRAVAENTTVEYEQFYPPLDTWFEVRGFPSKDGINIFFRDITERKQNEEKLSFMASIVESSDNAITGKTLDGIILSWNPGAEKIYGYSADEITGKPISILVPPDRPYEMPQLLERLRKGEHIEHFETVRMRKDGKHIDVSLTISPIKDVTGKIIAASTIARDITERKRMEEKLRRHQEVIRELSTPVLQVREQIFILPIIGMIDSLRARQLTEQLLHAIYYNSAKVVVMDITGVPTVDSKVANHLVQTIDSSRLMGATVVVTGVSPEIAQTLVTLGVDTSKMNTAGDLQGGIEAADKLLGYKITKIEPATDLPDI